MFVTRVLLSVKKEVIFGRIFWNTTFIVQKHFLQKSYIHMNIFLILFTSVSKHKVYDN